MSLKDDVLKIRQPNPKAAKFYQTAAAFIDAHPGTLAVILPGTEEAKAWQAYFDFLGWEPQVWTMLRKRQISSATMPASLPEWFDTTYALNERRPAPERPAPRLIDKDAVDRIDRQYGPNWGLKVGGKGLKPLPEERITRRAVSPRPKMPAEADIPSPEETPADRLARLKATPVEVSPDLAARFTSRNESAA